MTGGKRRRSRLGGAAAVAVGVAGIGARAVLAAKGAGISWTVIGIVIASVAAFVVLLAAAGRFRRAMKRRKHELSNPDSPERN